MEKERTGVCFVGEGEERAGAVVSREGCRIRLDRSIPRRYAQIMNLQTHAIALTPSVRARAEVEFLDRTGRGLKPGVGVHSGDRDGNGVAFRTTTPGEYFVLSFEASLNAAAQGPKATVALLQV